MNNYSELTHETFFQCWKDVCSANEQELIANWNNSAAYTKCILADKKDGIINIIAKELGKFAYFEYYSIDAVLYDKDDFIDGKRLKGPRAEYFLKRIQLAFEHENDPNTIYKEISHLLTTNASHRVLVTYSCTPDPEDMKSHIEKQADNTSDIDTEILVIVGFADKEIKQINWNGYKLKNGNAVKIE